MDVCEVMKFIILGIILGMVGQGARAIVGLKKNYDKESNEWFKARILLISLMIGGIAGALGAITLLGENIDKKTVTTQPKN